jgi:hypothetical protein
MKVTNYCKMEQRQRYNGPGKKNNASTNKKSRKSDKNYQKVEETESRKVEVKL